MHIYHHCKLPQTSKRTLMAEAALFNISQAVLKQLGSKVLQEAALLWGIGDDVKKLTRTLSSIQAVLLDAEEKSHSPRSHQLRLWLKELRQVVYEAEDLLDDFSIEVQRRQGMATAGEKISKEVRSFFSSSNQVAYGLKIAHGIQAIRATLDEIAERREMFHLEVQPVESMASKSREQTHSDVPEIVVGREDERERVLNQLLQHSSNCKDNVSVVSIVGIGGLGKTTLAQLLYNDEAVKSHFELKAWVCVSEKFEVKLIIEKIIESCTNQTPGRDLEMDTLRKRLYETMNGKRYLIVLDDVWSEDREKWSRLKGLLKGGAEGSRVMITTRLQNVAKLAATRGVEPYELKGLSERESWSLFQEIAFEGEAMSGRYESIGREILEKCKGVPLAIKTVAGALFFKESESEWIAFKSKGMWEMDDNENDIMPTLKLSYDHLPTHLKHCFAYCSLFPKDYEIDVETLIHLWIAQGFVQSSDPSNRFDVGLGYFKDLLWGSFFQEQKKGKRRNRVICKMHDLMHDLAIAIAGEEISAALAVLKSQDIQDYDSHLRISRHVLLDYWGCRFDKQIHEALSSIVNNTEANKVRTLLGINLVWGFFKLDPVIFSNTTSLRALDMSKFGMSMLSHTVHKLKHLKYFDLSCNKMTVLPEEITELINLEVLKLDDCSKLLQLPKGIGKLSCLFHLGVDGCDSLTCMPHGIGQLCYLRELPLFVIAEGDSESTSAAGAGIGELRYLNNLRGRLVITNLEKLKNSSEGELADLKGKQHLEELSLLWEEREGGIAVGAEAEGILLEALCPHPNLKKLWLKYNCGSECPSWVPSVMNLVELQIVGCQNWKRLPSLDQLPFLAELRLQDMESLEYIEYCGETRSSSSSSSFCSFFPSLKVLGLKRCPKFKGWLTPEAVAVVLPQFPCVSEVKISDCGSISSIPYFPLELITLKLKGGSKELLKQILRMRPSSSPSSLFPPRSSCLNSVKISKILDLDTLPEETLLRLTYSFSSLEMLTINNCPELRTLYPAVPHHLTSLRCLNIWRCEKLDLCDGDDDEMMQQQQLHGGVLLPLLSEVYLNGIPKLSRLPEWFQLAPELLQIWAFNCPIAYMPEWMPKLVHLQTLMINSYGKSASQCVHEDWSKIAHISKISINNVYIHEQAAGEEKFKELEEEEEETPVIEAAEEEQEETSKLLQFFVMNCGMVGRCFQG
ncbi:unnamed protein product [Linum tenue]|uniref:Disease resistance protein RGA3 n=1 Tax=Linum tenue TaxID=586396 RepID=A0AAV0NH66_9ROSI|nr:unnamed protein product [Linum tenue]